MPNLNNILGIDPRLAEELEKVRQAGLQMAPALPQVPSSPLPVPENVSLQQPPLNSGTAPIEELIDSSMPQVMSEQELIAPPAQPTSLPPIDSAPPAPQLDSLPQETPVPMPQRQALTQPPPAPKQDLLSAYLQKLQGGDTELAAAQEHANKQRKLAQMLSGIDRMSRGIAGATSAPSAYKGLEAGADQRVKDLLTQRASQEKRVAMLQKLWEMKHGKPMSAFERGTLNLRRAEQAQKPQPLSKGGEAEDRAFGKDVASWKSEGGLSAQMRNLEQLDEVIDNMDKAKESNWASYTGPFKGLIWDKIRNITNPAAKAAEDRVKNSVTATLRATLGAQFTEKEGERIFRQSWNDQAPPEENLKNIKRIYQQLKRAVKAKHDLVQYWETHSRTLQGAPGINDLYSISAQLTGDKDLISPEKLINQPPGETKVIGGTTYKKVPGGWEEVE